MYIYIYVYIYIYTHICGYNYVQATEATALLKFKDI